LLVWATRGPERGMDQAPVVVDYRPEWTNQASETINLLRNNLGDVAMSIEHIGSTSIPSMPAKDMLDLQVSVPDLDLAVQTFGRPLQAFGYERSPYELDHVPVGTDHDPGNWAKRLWLLRPGALPDVNLHVRRVGSPNERLALLFRDWFRSHPEAIPAYGRFKQTLAANLATPVVDLVIVMAESWARESGWQPRPSIPSQP
jgi:GrpB-like predicted nucleotidyltransferase (UPF0157 family)